MDQLKNNVVIYARVSSSEQSVINQIKVLEHIAEQNNWNLIDTYIDEGISGKYGRDRRPEFNLFEKCLTFSSTFILSSFSKQDLEC